MDKKLICSEFNKFILDKYGLNYPKTKVLDEFENKLILKTYDYPSKLSTESNSEFISNFLSNRISILLSFFSFVRSGRISYRLRSLNFS